MTLGKESERSAFLLCAGEQTRFKDNESKFMVFVEGRPSFFYTMQTVLTIFPEEHVTIVTSMRYQDFVDYLTTKYPKANIVVDEKPGRGTACSLRNTLPWNTPHVFVSEGDIYFQSNLILAQLQALQDNPESQVVMSVTPKVDIATTHRMVEMIPTLRIFKEHEVSDSSHNRNIGAYTLSRDMGDYLTQSNNLIDVIRILNEAGGLVVALAYLDMYLHMATTADIARWQKALGDTQ